MPFLADDLLHGKCLNRTRWGKEYHITNMHYCLYTQTTILSHKHNTNLKP